MSGVLLLAVLFLLAFAWIGGALYVFHLAWERYVVPAVERHYARKNGWPADWLRQERERSEL